MARMTRSQRRDDTRERLIDAARAVFASHGYTAATVAQISDGAGFTSGAFYSNFPSKNALAREIASHDIEFDTSQVARVADALAQGADAVRAALLGAIDESAADADRNRLRLELLLHGTRDPGLGAILRTQFAVSRARNAEMLSHVFATLGRQPPASPADLASLLLSVSHGFKVMSLAGDPTALIPLIDIVLAAIIGGAPPVARGEPKD